MSLSQNQFSMIPVKGQLDLRVNPAIVGAQVSSTSSGGLVAGQPVKRVNTASGVPLVVECAADSDDIFGFIVYNIKNPTFGALDQVDVAVQKDNFMYMEASAAIAIGDSVMVVLSGVKIATATTGKRIVGTAYDKAAASGDLIRVAISLPGALA